MGKANVADIIEGATKVAYPDNYKFCNRVVRAIMSVVPKDRLLENKEIEIMGVMCSMCIEGKDYMKVNAVREELERCGFASVGYQTMRNYQSGLRTKGWLEGQQLTFKLLKAIKDARFSVIIFFDKDGKV